MQNRINLIALKSILHKEVHRFKRIWVQTLVPKPRTGCQRDEGLAVEGHN